MTAKLSRILIPLALVVAVAAAAVSQASTGDGGALVPSWANANICSPTQFGVRAQLAGDGSDGDLKARFSAQWLNGGSWVPLSGAVSPWQTAGSAAYTWQQVGWTFQLAPPATGQSYQVRGVAELQWPSGRTETRTTGTCTVSG
jgi:hypothetical protein